MSEDFAPKPIVRRRAKGDWLAVSPRGARFGIGVTAQTEDAAVQDFFAAYRRWTELLAAAEALP